MLSLFRRIRAHNCTIQAETFQARADELRRHVERGAVYHADVPVYRQIIRTHERHARKWRRFAAVMAG